MAKEPVDKSEQTAATDPFLAMAGKNLRRIRMAADLNQQELADKAKVTKWEVSRLENGRVGTRALAGKFAAALGVTVDSIWPETNLGKSPYRRVKVIGRVAAGAWRESFELPYDEQEETVVVLPAELASVPISSFIVDGESVNKVYPNGSIVYVAPLYYRPGSPKNGDIVLVHREDANGLHESTLKEYQKDPTGRIWLLPQSTAPEHQLPIEATGKNIEKVEITGVVVAAMVFPG